MLLESLEDRRLLSGTITGLVFQDYNANGTYDTTSTIANASTGTVGVAVDHGIANVTVTAYDNSGVNRGTSNTAANGTYSLAATGTGPYRVVFTNLPAGTSEGPNGPNSASTVQIVPNGNSTNASLGVSVSNDYSPNDPLIVANQYIYGDPIGGAYANNPTIIGFPYSSGSQYGGSGDYAQPSSYIYSVPAKSVGATFGLGFSQATGTLYSSSYTKRFAGYGPNAAGTGTTDGAIYTTNSTTGATTVLADLNTIFGANTAGVNFRTLGTWTGYATDGGNTGWDAVGKSSLGGLVVSPDGSTVYVMNLSDRSLYSIPTSGPINSTTVHRISIPFNAPGATGTLGGTTAGDLRPFAVTYHNGLLYVGIVNSAESTQNAADLKAYVYAVNPATLAFGASPVFQTSLNYTRGTEASYSGVGNPSANWNPWSTTFRTIATGNTAAYAQPMLSGIAFDATGNMVLGLRDRNGDQTGFFTNSNPANPAQTYEGISAGDTLEAFANIPGNVAGGWTLENNGRGPAGQGTGPQNTNLGPGGAAFYYQQSFITSGVYHSNVNSGGVYELPGFNDVISSSFDPGTTTARTGGLRFLNATTGATDKAFQIYNTGFNAPPQATFGKANGIGDVTAFTSLAPIEIGDRVFQDLKDDGLQDPGDPGIAGVTVHLYQGAALVGTTLTDANGNYLFNSSDVPAGLLPNTAYQVRFDRAADWAAGGALYGKVVSIPNADPAGVSGSKAILVGGVVVINETTGGAGFNDHSLDAGFVATGAVSGTVFNDSNNNGVQNGGEAGLAGVTLTLTGTNDLGQAVSVTATTDASGNYTFPGLRPSNATGYTITETLPNGELLGKDAAGTIGGTAPTNSTAIQGIVVTPAANGTGYTFGNLLPASLAGFAYFDSNDDGIKQAGEQGIPGVTVTLTGNNDLGLAVNLTTTTLGDGSYSFANLRPSNATGYTITETRPAAYLDGKDTIGTPGGTAGNNVFSQVVLNPGVAGANNNFGNLLPSSLAGRVYFDANDDGVKQSTEQGIPGVTVTLTGTNDLNQAVNLTTTTAADGSYSFANLRPSTAAGYAITETQPAGYLDGQEKVGTQGSGTIGTNTFTGIVLASGINGVTNDFGELQPSSLAGFVYVDSSDDGIKQASEAGIAGVTVTLTGTNDLNQAVNLTTTTAADGSYTFANLRPSNGTGYTLTETQPAGFLDGKDTIGTPGGIAGNDVFSAIGLVSGFNGVNNNFGELQAASLAGFVYVDANGDGLKQNTEAGIAGVTVTLTGKDDLGNTVNLTTTTAADGSYIFTGLRPSGAAGYAVTDTPPAAYTVEKNNVGTSGGTLSNPNSIIQIAIGSGATATRYYFGDTGATIAGTAFVDANANGTDDSGEAGLAGATITLLNSANQVVGTTTSAADGSYSFANLPAGSYTVVETQPTGYGTSTPLSDPVTLSTAGQAGVNFGSTTSSLSGVDFTDVNGNGTYQQGVDLVGAGGTVTLTGVDINGKAVNLTTTTAADGTFVFTGLLASNGAGYTVSAPVSTGETAGTATPGTAGGTAGANNDTVTNIVLAAGSTATGYQYPSTGTNISGLVFVDQNNNGVADTGEVGVAGVTITLKTSAGVLVTTTTTGADGTYSIVGQPAGTYMISETVPTGYGTTTTTTLTNVVVTASGVQNENFGLSASSLSGTVYNDLNNNGALTPGEPGIVGVTVNLLNASNVVIATTTTAADGSYSFLNLPAGTYSIQEVQPTAYSEGQDTAGPAGGSTTTIDLISGITLPVTTASPGYNFGERGAAITGEVYVDKNANNAIDPGEVGLGGVTVDLLNASGVQVASTVSAADGTFSFPNLPAGTYSTHEERPNGYGSSAPITRAVTLTTTGAAPVNYGLTTSTLSGQTYLDLNNDGTPEAGEPPIAGVTITLIGTDANGGSVIATTTTAADGTYSFAGLLAGTYSIAEAQPSAYRIGQASAGTSGGTIGTDLIVGIGLGSAVTGTGYNFGSLGYPISGTVFVDANKDGVLEPGEVGLAGVPLTLQLVNQANQVVATTTSAANGTYTFPNVVAGSYSIVEVPPSGYGTSTPTSVPVTVSNAGLVNENFGVTTASLSGVVFLDANKNSIYNPGLDQVAPGLPITLTGTDINGKAVNLTVPSAADGSFDFTGLLAGTYSVSAPALPGVVQQPGIVGTSGGTVVGLDLVNNIVLPVATDATGYLLPAQGVAISGTVYQDDNRDGLLETGEAGVPGATVTLTQANPVTGIPTILTTTTDALGNYSFPSAVAEQGTIAITTPANYASDTPTTLAVSVPLTGLANQNFGLTTASIAGKIFADGNDDGLQQGTDPGIANVVLLLSGTDTGGHAVSLSTITAADGSYLFSGLNPGTYTVTKLPPTGYLDGIITAGSTEGTVGAETISAITVATGQASTGNNFAELLPASLAGTVFVDASNDGIKDASEVGVLGVTVTLTGVDDLGNPVNLTTTTRASGNYSFTNLRPSNAAGYTITETRPAGYLDGIDTVGSQGGTLGNRSVTGIALAAGIAGATNNFAELAPGTVTGTVFIDSNDNRSQESGEGGIAGVVVTLTGVDDLGNPVNLTATTNASGVYSFGGLRPSGSDGYTVTEAMPAGYLPGLGAATSTLSTGIITGVILAPGATTSPGISFPELLPASLSGYVYQDLNDGGAKGLNEPGIPGTTVTLTGFDDRQNPVLLTAVTDANGFYSFTNLRPSLNDLQSGLVTGYTLTETQPAGFLDGKDAIGTPGGVAANDVFSKINLPSGFAGVNNNFGELPPVSLSGYVYVDANDDGIKQAGEAGIAGVTLTLTGVDDLGAPVSLTTTTAADGSYSFANLRPSGPGGYAIAEPQPSTYLDGKSTIGSQGGSASGDLFGGIVAVAGTVGTNNNFGELAPAGLSGFVYVDANGDGIKEAGEAGIAGVTLTLTGVDDLGQAVSVQATTAADGSYAFPGLRPSNVAGYKITETPPAGYLDGKDSLGTLGGLVGTDMLSGIVLASGNLGPNYNFANVTASSLSGFVYLDANNDGIKGGTETGIGGVTVTLTGVDVNGHAVKTFETTAADGSYHFTGLLPGTYSVTDVPPSTYVQGLTSAGTSAGTVAGNVVSGISLGSSVAATAYNFGETGVSISGTAYADNNNDGKLDPGDMGLGGVTITLLNAQGQPVATTTTAPDGSYSFGNLAIANYTVVESTPSGMMATSPAMISVCCCSGAPVTGQDFGTTSAAAISGTVYVDSNNDGLIQPGEKGLGGVTVTLTGTNTLGQPVSLTTTTAANGNYSFLNLSPGVYTLTGSSVAAYGDGKDSAGTAGGTVSPGDKITGITLGSGVVAYNDNFGKVGSTLTGTVALGGVPDSGASVSVSEDGMVVGMGTTGPDGTYVIPGLPAGPAVVTVVVPNPGGMPTIQTAPASLAAGSASIANFTSAAANSATVSGFVYNDLNGSGVKNGSDPGIPAVLMTLGGTDLNGNIVYRQVYTGPDGSFSFTGLPAGTYNVLEGPAGSYINAKVSAGSLGGLVTSRLVGPFAVAAGASGVNYDFGHQAPSIVAGFVYNDLSGSGVKNPSDPGIPAVLVTLGGTDLNGNTVYRQVYTGPDGSFTFSGLPAGHYSVLEGPTGAYLNAKVSPGTPGGAVNNRLIGPFDLGAGICIPDNNFGQVVPSAIAGTVYIDANKTGVLNNDFGVANIPVMLQGRDMQGRSVSLSTTTGADGTYAFGGLMPGVYQVTADRLNKYFNAGADNIGTAGGSARGNTIATIPLGGGTVAAGYNFGEIVRKGCVLALPQVNALLKYGPHPGGVPASLLKGVSIPAGSVTAYYVPTLAAEVNVAQQSLRAKSVAASASTPVSSTVQVGVQHPSATASKATSKSKQAARGR